MTQLPELLQWGMAIASIVSAFAAVAVFFRFGSLLVKVGHWMGDMEARVQTVESSARTAHRRLDGHLDGHPNN